MKHQFTQRVNLDKKYCPTCHNTYEGNVVECPKDKTPLRGGLNDPYIGKVFADRYEIESILGFGGMSVVYKAKHKLMDRTVAIKMLHNKLKEDSVARDRFQVEAQACSSLNHQNVITVYDFGVTSDGEPFFVMDCLEGESLKDLIDRKFRLTVDRALPIFRQIADGLDAAHKKGIVHRDLKPANVILVKQDDGSECVKLVDFGIAKVMPQEGKEAHRLTQTGEVFGSPLYMSPEQCKGKDLDNRSDIYALGCVMYEALSGIPPFEGGSFLETMNMHVGNEARPINDVEADAKVPREIQDVIDRCMEKNPDQRFQSAAEVRDVITAVTIALLGHSGKHVAGISLATTALKRVDQRPSVGMVISSVLICMLVVAGIFLGL
ncbi:MAG TPA: serine/threonine-protein kinase, partial [Chroococcales cyanobacterium]